MKKFIPLFMFCLFAIYTSAQTWTQTLPGTNMVRSFTNGFSIQQGSLWATTNAGIVNLTDPNNPAKSVTTYTISISQASITPVATSLVIPPMPNPYSGFMLFTAGGGTITGGAKYPSNVYRAGFPYNGYNVGLSVSSPLPTLPATTVFTGFAITEQGYIYLGTTGSNSGVFRTKSTESNFTSFNQGSLMTVARNSAGVAPVLPCMNINAIIACNNDIYGATDGGIIKLSNDLGNWSRVGGISVKFTALAVSGTDLFATDGKQIYHAYSGTNGGLWSELALASSGLPENCKINTLFIDQDTAYVGVASEGAIFRSTRAANKADWNEWKIFTPGMGILTQPVVKSVNCFSRFNGYLYAGTDQGVWVLSY